MHLSRSFDHTGSRLSLQTPEMGSGGGNTGR